jgi:hypothetical protein
MREMVKAGRPARKRLEFLKLARFRSHFGAESLQLNINSKTIERTPP